MFATDRVSELEQENSRLYAENQRLREALQSINELTELTQEDGWLDYQVAFYRCVRISSQALQEGE